MSSSIVVLKLGGSVLTSRARLPAVAREVDRWVRGGYRVVAVASALRGATDRLTGEAGRLASDPQPAALAALLATAEARSAAGLVLALDAAGLTVRLLENHCLDLRTEGPVLDASPRSVDLAVLARALSQAQVVVVPGFSGIGEAGGTSLLGRGGSDLTALFLAARLGARCCRLIKDVGGWYAHDPKEVDREHPTPRPKRYRSLSWEDALASRAPVVQPKAVRLAHELDIPFEVGSLAGQVTRVGPYETVAVAPVAGRVAVVAPPTEAS